MPRPRRPRADPATRAAYWLTFLGPWLGRSPRTREERLQHRIAAAQLMAAGETRRRRGHAG